MQLRQHGCAGRVPDAAFLAASDDAHSLRQMALPDSALTDDHEVLVPIDPREGREVEDVRAVESRLKREVERRKRRLVGEAGVVKAALDASFPSTVDLDAQQAFETVEDRDPTCAIFGQGPCECLGSVQELELFEEAVNPRCDVIHDHCSSPRIAAA
jgi:hypothetical protein